MYLVIYGTRPEEIKLYPFSKYEGFVFVEVNQSKDLHQGLIRPHYKIEEDELRSFVERFGRGYKGVIVQGDTRTAFFGALWAFHNKIPVIHIEAGVRSGNLWEPFPEEAYRRMIDQIAVLRFSATPQDAKNCNGIFVGQTGIDTLFELAPKVKNGGYTLVTLHRRENKEKIDKYIKLIKSEKRNFKIIAHPNPTGQELKKHFKTLDPVPYKEFVKLLAEADEIWTDSGGLQEEAQALGKKVRVLRDYPDRPFGYKYRRGATKKIIQYLWKNRSLN